MTPLSDTFLMAAIYAGIVWAGCWGLYAVMRWRMVWGVALALVAAVVAVAGVLMEGDVFREISPAHFRIYILICVTPVLVLVWVILVHRFTRAVGVALLALALPSLAIAGIYLERQTVPEAVCSQSHIVVEVGGQSFKLARELGATVYLTARPDQPLDYGHGNTWKEDMHVLCEQTEAGAQPAVAGKLVVRPFLAMRQLDALCGGELAPRYCQGLQDWDLRLTQSVTILAQGDGVLGAEIEPVRASLEAEALSGGDAETGFLCDVVPNTEMAGHCRDWRMIGPQTIAVMATSEGRGTDPVENLLAQSERVLEFYLQALAP